MNLKINEKEYPLQWGMGALEMFCDTLDCEIEDLDVAFVPGRKQGKYLTTLVLSGLKNGAGKESAFEDFEVSYKDVQAFLDNAEHDELKAIIKDFMDSKYFGKTISAHLLSQVSDVDEETKKKE